ncbi:MAG: glutamine amidotransferase [Desulfobacter sp.]|nr:glutamine amidotransferase [Desulfobacter sp.]WDP87388.1 MAG: glutamine amidotransferase [Desulfobacter sp.]
MSVKSNLLVVKAGDSFPDLVKAYGDFEDWIIKGLGQDRDRIQVVNAEKSHPLPDPETIAGAVISGAHAMVTQDLDWSLALEAWTREMVAARVPLLGICYGHQIIAKAMGGRVDFHPRGSEVGTRRIHCLPAAKKDVLFRELPENFMVHLFHSQSVTHLPAAAEVLAKNDFDPYQAFCIKKTAWGVQFHPEADAAVTRGYIENLTPDLEKEGQNPNQLIDTLGQTPYAAALLKRFGDLVMDDQCRLRVQS